LLIKSPEFFINKLVDGAKGENNNHNDFQTIETTFLPSSLLLSLLPQLTFIPLDYGF